MINKYFTFNLTGPDTIEEALPPLPTSNHPHISSLPPQRHGGGELSKHASTLHENTQHEPTPHKPNHPPALPKSSRPNRRGIHMFV